MAAVSIQGRELGASSDSCWEAEDQQGCALRCPNRPRNGKGKAEMRCQGRWRSGDKEGRGQLNKRGNKVVGGRKRVLEIETTSIVEHIRTQVFFLSLHTGRCPPRFKILIQKYILVQTVSVPGPFRDWETSGLDTFFTYICCHYTLESNNLWLLVMKTLKILIQETTWGP